MSEGESWNSIPNFTKITNEDKTSINYARLNLFGLFLFKNRHQAKRDFLNLAKEIYFAKEDQHD